jgi:hypothetical protein
MGCSGRNVCSIVRCCLVLSVRVALDVIIMFGYPYVFTCFDTILSLLARDSSVGIAFLIRAGRSEDRIPLEDEISRTRPKLSWGPHSLLYNGYRVFVGGKAAGA